MTYVSADRIALRDTDTVKPQPREVKHPSFESHVRQGKDDGNAHESAMRVSPLPDDAKPGSAIELARLPTEHTLADEIHALPLASTDPVFGTGATIYPQSLSVVGYLSMLPAGAPMETSTTVQAADVAPAKATTGAPLPPSASGAISEALSEDSPSATPAVVIAGDARRIDGGDEAIERTGDTLVAAETTPWLLRRMSFSGSGADATLRLRDYRLPAGKEGELAERLLSIARDQGWPAARVVVNGHEIWRRSGASLSPDSQRTQSHVG